MFIVLLLILNIFFIIYGLTINITLLEKKPRVLDKKKKTLYAKKHQYKEKCLNDCIILSCLTGNFIFFCSDNVCLSAV